MHAEIFSEEIYEKKVASISLCSFWKDSEGLLSSERGEEVSDNSGEFDEVLTFELDDDKDDLLKLDIFV